jgi:hypothetical protein
LAAVVLASTLLAHPTGFGLSRWMITSSVQNGSGRGPNLDLCSRARQTGLDEPPADF